MKAILLAGGKGTRLRPLTVHTPKPIVPIFNRAFLHYQIDLLKQVPEIDEVILSLNYQPRRIEEMFGDGADLGIKIRYVVEPIPLGTAGAIKYAGDKLTESVVVFNGDVMTELDLAAVIRLASRTACAGDHRADAGRQSLGVRPGRNRPARQHPAIRGETQA
jgi:NDP-sugar pyrophosphorylase family protein